MQVKRFILKQHKSKHWVLTLYSTNFSTTLTAAHPKLSHLSTLQKFADILSELPAASSDLAQHPPSFPDRWYLFPSLFPKLKAVFSSCLHPTGLSLSTVHFIKGPMTNSDWESIALKEDTGTFMFPTVRGWLVHSYILAVRQTHNHPCSCVHSDTLCPCEHPEVHREAQALCPLLSGRARHPAVRSWSVGAGFGQHLDHLAHCTSQHETQGKCGCRSQGSQPLHPHPEGSNPDLSHRGPPPAPNPPAPAKPHMANRTPVQTPSGTVHLHPALHLLSMASLSSHLPFHSFTRASRCHRHFIKGCHLQASNRNEAWCRAGFRIQTDSSGGQTPLVQSFCLDWPYFSSIRFSHYLFLEF